VIHLAAQISADRGSDQGELQSLERTRLEHYDERHQRCKESYSLKEGKR